MATAKISLALFALAALYSAVSAANDAPVPAPDCTDLILQMADCLSFVSNGSTITKPSASCCSGIKTVIKTNAECLCQAFDSSASFGVVLDVPKAITLPALCKVDATAAKCKFSNSPSAAPVVTPTASSPAAAVPEKREPESAPAPGKSAATGVFVSIGSVIGAIGLAVLCSV